jgi:hypothetical protein
MIGEDSHPIGAWPVMSASREVIGFVGAGAGMVGISVCGFKRRVDVMKQWSLRFLPTGRSWIRGIESDIRSSAGPIPDKRSIFGVSSEPAERMISLVARKTSPVSISTATALLDSSKRTLDTGLFTLMVRLAGGELRYADEEVTRKPL